MPLPSDVLAWCHRELDAYGPVAEYRRDGVEVTLAEDGELGRVVPTLRVDGRAWITLTASELLLHREALRRATGRVATAGLGLGYFTLRAAAKSEVLSVDAYEKDPGVIALFGERLGARPEAAKVRMIEGDAREIMVAGYDFLFVDIAWRKREALRDEAYFRPKATDVLFWASPEHLTELQEAYA